MNKASEYQEHAAHCRLLARGMDGDQREQLLAMAANWDRLVEQRLELLQRHPELSDERPSWKPAS